MRVDLDQTALAEARSLRRAYVFGAMCVAFGAGAAIGAFATEVTRAYSLAIPVALLLVILLLFCEQKQIDTRS